jgi:tyrosyl-tRNA synthetase
MESKLELARRIVATYHDEEDAARGEEHFTRVVRRGQAPEEVEEVEHADPVVHLPQLLAGRFGETSSHWRRVIDQGGVKADGATLTAYDVPTEELAGKVVQAGKRRFLRIRGPS